jgi:hypothetical protein
LALEMRIDFSISGNSNHKKGIARLRPLSVVTERYKGIVPETLGKALSIHHRE